MLTEADLRILAALDTPAAITELSDRTEYSPGYVSERVTHRETYDLVGTSRQNRAKDVRALHTPVLDTYRALTADNPHIDFPSLISPSMLRVCWFLDTPTTVRDIKARLTLQRRRIYQLLERLQARGLITKDGSQFSLTDGLKGLARFAQTVIKYEHQHRAQTRLPTATVVWSAPHETLITTRDETVETVVETFEDQGGWHMTGLPRFDDYGLEFFIAGAPSYFYSERRDTLTPVDFISHTLVLDADTRSLSYCALLLLATEVSFEELRAKHRTTGLKIPWITHYVRRNER